MSEADEKQTLTLDQLIELALAQGLSQVEAAGSPLHPFYFSETGQMHVMFNPGDADPMELAYKAIKSESSDIQRCALVIDTRVTLSDGKKWDAIAVMACERDNKEGPMWVQRYVPKRLFRKFRKEGEPEVLGKTKNFIKIALSNA